MIALPRRAVVAALAACLLACAPAAHAAFVEDGPRERAVVWAFGDADDSADAKKLAAMIARRRADRLLYLGDIYEDGRMPAFERWASVWGRFAERMAPTPGNHEWATAREGYNPYWRAIHGQDPPSAYAFTVAGWEVLSLNSEAAHGRGSAQHRWLRRAVAAPSGTCRIAFWHRPRLSAGPEPGERTLEPLWRELRGRARIVLSGHEHNLQRLTPRDGLRQFIAGAGGRGTAPLDPDHPRLAFGDTRHTGALRLTLTPRRARWAFVAADGRVLDAGALRCAL
jgi:hypothetical protein